MAAKKSPTVGQKMKDIAKLKVAVTLSDNKIYTRPQQTRYSLGKIGLISNYSLGK